MMPAFVSVRAKFPKSESREMLFTELGWADIIDHAGYKDTCAIRMSMALLHTGLTIPGASMRVKAGPLKGKRIEPRQRRLSTTLKQLWGQPESYGSEKTARAAIGDRSGLISFFRIGGGPGGHIDLINPGPNGFAECMRSCFFGCQEIWFWPLR